MSPDDSQAIDDQVVSERVQQHVSQLERQTEAARQEMARASGGTLEERSMRVLEFPQILEEVGRHAQWGPGRERVLALLPTDDRRELDQRRTLVAEAIKLAEEGIGLGLGGLEDVREEVEFAARGGTLPAGALWQIREVCVASRKLSRVLDSRRVICPELGDRSRFLYTFSKIESEIPRCLTSEGRVQDGASARLRELRLEIRDMESQIQRNLYNLLHDTEILKLVQEPIVMQRQNRYVIPIKAENRSRFPGLVIDQSSTGVTYFMEPLSVLPLSNRLRTAQLAEEKEVETILQTLSGHVSLEAERLQISCEEMADIDLYSAQAHYALKVEGHLPEIDDGLPLKLLHARHPLLLAHGIKAVPISLEIGGKDCRTLVLTGPNTGGKTVALKTIGLLTLMALSGLPIPASSQSSIPFLDSVHADIGDDQSIAQSLSTFSAHLTQILRILPRAKKRSLILLDELGAGTDPVEGAALGVSLMENFHRRGALTVVTTHLSEVKVFASKTQGFENAAVEFDATTLAPTFKVVMGIPGRSNALLIAARLGLPDDVLRRSRELLGKDQAAVEGLLDDLERERTMVRGLEKKLMVEDDSLRQARLDYEKKLQELEAFRAHILAQAATQAEKVLNDARQRSHGLLRDFRSRLEKLEKARQQALLDAREAAARARDFEKDEQEETLDPFERLTEEELDRLTAPTPSAEEEPLPEPPVESGDDLVVEEEPVPTEASTETPEKAPTEDALDLEGRVAGRTLEAEWEQLRSQIRSVVPVVAAPVVSEPEEARPTGNLQSGLRVYSRRFGQEGEILKVRGDRVEVRLGSVRMTVPAEDLEPVAQPAPSESIGSLPGGLSDRDVSSRVDLRGMTVEEALYELGKRIDQGVLARLPKLEVIHGKGTGTLRVAVQKFLRSHALVTEQRLGEVYEGSYGVTIVSLKV